ncbi:EGF-like domain-containing protein [Pleurotus pulmonarius]
MFRNLRLLPPGILAFLCTFIELTNAQSPPIVVCAPGQCLQGYSNITIGATVSSSQTTVQLLPGQYTSTTNPQLLHDILTSRTSSLSSSPGFGNATSINLPLELALDPGIAVFPQPLYAGQSAFAPLPISANSSLSTSLSTTHSIALTSNTWIALDNRVVLWDSVPDMRELPFGNTSTFSLVAIQSSACSPACSSTGGVCSSSGTWHFGATCQSCEAGCTSCDEGIAGSGRCLDSPVKNVPATCNCLNGVCGANGDCACNAGFVKADNGTACAKCDNGFFQTSTGDCKLCQLGCDRCADGTSVCLACKSGFTQDANDRTKCTPVPTSTSSGTICPQGSFANGATCSPCSPSCQSCTGGTSNDCTVCAPNTFAFNGGCVRASADGVCEGSTRIADNNKRSCDACPAKCSACRIPNFDETSIASKLQCTACIPGSFLSNGQCVDACPAGTVVSSQDNFTCTPCDSSCTSCAGDPKFCLTCANNQLATSDGKCVQSCPSNTFSSSSSTTCTVCHPDCASCSGGAFNQCTACPPERPVLANGRCLPTCAKSQFLDPTSSTCQSCDSTCSSCSAAGPSSCLACSDNTQVLRAGRCVAANCSGSSTVLPGLGVCLSELVSVPQPSGTGTAPPLPTVTGLDTPTVVTNSGKRGLEWWQILLMALGCAFIFLVFVWLFRRRARKARAKRTAAFAFAQGAVPPSTGAGWWWRLKRAIVWGRSASPSTARRNVLVRNSPPHPATAPSGGRSGGGGDWKWWLVRWGEKLFGHRKSQRVFHNTQPQPQRIYKISEPFGMMHDAESMRLQRLRAAEEARRGEEDYDMLLGQYDYPRPGDGGDGGAVGDSVAKMAKKGGDNWNRSRDSLMSAPSIYSQMTGMPRKGPDPRIPVKR